MTAVSNNRPVATSTLLSKETNASLSETAKKVESVAKERGFFAWVASLISNLFSKIFCCFSAQSEPKVARIAAQVSAQSEPKVARVAAPVSAQPEPKVARVAAPLIDRMPEEENHLKDGILNLAHKDMAYITANIQKYNKSDVKILDLSNTNSMVLIDINLNEFTNLQEIRFAQGDEIGKALTRLITNTTITLTHAHTIFKPLRDLRDKILASGQKRELKFRLFHDGNPTPAVSVLGLIGLMRRKDALMLQE